MDNQHRQIKGYRELSQDEIDAMNRIKTAGASIGELLDEVSKIADVDQRWVAVAKTHLQQGFMALTRSVAKPDFF